jgi:hypothetical protein
MAFDRTRTLRGALAGAAAAGVWAAQQPLDKRVFGSGYDDVELLGRAVTRGPAWYPAGLGLHIANGAMFGAVYSHVAPITPIPAVVRGVAAGLAEHLALWPLVRLSDRVHPARGDLPRLDGNVRAFAQAAWRHALFGLLLGELERRLNADREIDLPDYEAVVSPNGHGHLEHTVTVGPTAS